MFFFKVIEAHEFSSLPLPEDLWSYAAYTELCETLAALMYVLLCFEHSLLFS